MTSALIDENPNHQIASSFVLTLHYLPSKTKPMHHLEPVETVRYLPGGQGEPVQEVADNLIFGVESCKNELFIIKFPKS